MVGPGGPAGSVSGARTQGLSRNLGDLHTPSETPRRHSGDLGQAGREPNVWGHPVGTNKYPQRGNRSYEGNRGGRGAEKSERSMVPMKPGNPSLGDSVEGRENREGRRVTEPLEGKMAGRPGPGTVSTKQERIAELARQMPSTALSTLSHHMDLNWLVEAYRRTRKDGAKGVDGQSAKDYAENLEENLESLLDRAKKGTYRAPPVRRVEIPKGDGRTRPIGIPTFEDKVLQRAVVMLLEPIYEEDFYDFSYGFRPRRSPHDALQALDEGLRSVGGGWVLDVDLKSFFDTISHEKLRHVVSQRVADGVVKRLIGKWLVRQAKPGRREGDVETPKSS